MSIASAYADLQRSAATKAVDANRAEPPPFECAAGSLHVSAEGQLRIVPKASWSDMTMTPDEVLEAAQWMIATFS